MIPEKKKRLWKTPVHHPPAALSGRGRRTLRWAPRVLRGGHSVQPANRRLPARDPLSGHVAPGMFRQVVAAHETPVAHCAHELLLPSVSSAVAREFIRTSKFLVAAIPAAAERLLS